MPGYICVAVREPLLRATFLLSPYGFCGLKLGHRVWWPLSHKVCLFSPTVNADSGSGVERLAEILYFIDFWGETEAVWTVVCDQDHTWSWKPGQFEISPVLLCIKAMVMLKWSGTGPQSQGEGWSSHAASMAGAKKVSIIATTMKAKTLSVSELFSSLLGWPTH